MEVVVISRPYNLSTETEGYKPDIAQEGIKKLYIPIGALLMKLEKDHIWPLCEGGPNSFKNI